MTPESQLPGLKKTVPGPMESIMLRSSCSMDTELINKMGNQGGSPLITHFSCEGGLLYLYDISVSCVCLDGSDAVLG